MRLRRGGQPIICRDESANRNAREFVEEREHGLPYRAADQFEIDVDTIGAGGSKLVGEARRAMIDRSIEAKRVDEIGAFLRAAGNPHDPAALDLRDRAAERATVARAVRPAARPLGIESCGQRVSKSRWFTLVSLYL